MSTTQIKIKRKEDNMNKLEKINVIRRSLIFLIVFALVATLLIITSTVLWQKKQPKMYTSLYTAREMGRYPCLARGNVCSQEDIDKAIKVKLAVNDSQIYDFYLLSNDEETATFILAQNIGKITNWTEEWSNLKGPFSAMIELASATKDWEYIDPITDYTYLDYGNEFYKEYCSLDHSNDEDFYYDCTTDINPTRGYNGITIEKGRAHIEFNLNYSAEDFDYDYTGVTIPNYYFRARLLTYEDVTKNYSAFEDLPDWFMDNLVNEGGYWTASSSTYPTTQYTQGVFGVVNDNGHAMIKELFPLGEKNPQFKKLGIRPVITITK